MTLRVPALAAAALLAAPAHALATPAQGPLRAPDVSSALHVAATLPGAGWLQVVGASAGTAALGSYGHDVAGAACQVRIELGATATQARPRPTGRTVVAGVLTLRVQATGRHGPVTWWTGIDAGGDPALVGVQRAPRSLRDAGTPWVTYRGGTSRYDDCPGATLATRTARAVARSMRLAPGPVVPHRPYTTA